MGQLDHSIIGSTLKIITICLISAVVRA